MSVLGWIAIGLIGFNVVVFGLLAINDYLERRHRR